MKEETKKVLSDLYAIRATMSVVAINDDEADLKRRAIADCNASMRSLRDKIKDKENEKRQELFEFSIYNQIDKLNTSLKDAEEKLAFKQKEANHYRCEAEESCFVRYFKCWFECWNDLLSWNFGEYWVVILFVIFWSVYLLWVIISIPIAMIVAMIVAIRKKKNAKANLARLEKQIETDLNWNSEISRQIKAMENEGMRAIHILNALK